jgi:hypothetical protein
MSLIKEIQDNLSSTQVEILQNELEKINEGTGDLPEGMDIDQQFDLAVARLEAARRGMALVKKLSKFYLMDKEKFAKDPEALEKYKAGKESVKKNTSRIMSNLQTAGKLVDDIVDNIRYNYEMEQNSNGRNVGSLAPLNVGPRNTSPEAAASLKAQTASDPSTTPPSWKDRFKKFF